MLSTYQGLVIQAQKSSGIVRRVLGFHPGGELATFVQASGIIDAESGQYIHGAVVEYKSFLKRRFQEAICLSSCNSYFLDGYY
ncbi:hypothetical protein [Nostoc sp. UIC 10630]|uniref:hypothetical protein n=1 Tax=Nostoc sp. UIC 10630 TaxID=2100146 RepID=UPI0013D1F83A|nr:hypothetical protein [Nostoc sp. UIC 10630]NEU77602.1 hypothetical protein [Nostoc sp. UIC 10630]